MTQLPVPRVARSHGIHNHAYLRFSKDRLNDAGMLRVMKLRGYMMMMMLIELECTSCLAAICDSKSCRLLS